MTRSASQVGRSNRARGASFERDIAGYLRGVGFPHAERCRDNGFATSGRAGADGYDLKGVPGLLIDAKAGPDAAASQARTWLGKLAADADDRSLFPLLINKRKGHADLAQAWAWVRYGDLLGLTHATVELPVPALSVVSVAVRFELGDLVPLLRVGGFGEPLDGLESVA